MTERNFPVTETSIDENDIEIIPFNDFEINEQSAYLAELFLSGTNDPNPTIMSTQIPRLDREDSEEFEDETLVERLCGLTEMFPDWLRTVFRNTFDCSKTVRRWMIKTIWFFSSSFIILILPIFVQHEILQFTETESAQTRQILLGPSAQIGSKFAFDQI